MANKVHFYLKTKADKDGKCLIFLQVKNIAWRGEVNKFGKSKHGRFTWSFGETIDPDAWDKKFERPKKDRDKKKMLDKIELWFEEAWNKNWNGTPTTKMLEERMDAKLHQNLAGEITEDASKNFYAFLQGEIKNTRAENSAAHYQTILNYLPKDISFDAITHEFLAKFRDELEKRKKKNGEAKTGQSAINKYINLFKILFRKAVSRGIIPFSKIEDFTINRAAKAQQFALTREEIDKLYEWNGSGATGTFQQILFDVSRLFLVSCFTGYRISDFINISPLDIIKKADGEFDFNILTQKTKKYVAIPADPIILEIFKLYPKRPNMLPDINENSFNRYIKKACKLAGITETGIIAKKQLWQGVKPHTGRRTAATLWHTEYGMQIEEIMELLGHDKITTTQGYILPRERESTEKLRKKQKEMALAKA